MARRRPTVVRRGIDGESATTDPFVAGSGGASMHDFIVVVHRLSRAAIRSGHPHDFFRPFVVRTELGETDWPVEEIGALDGAISR